MEFKFEKLITWQKAMDFGEEMNRLADSFPKEEFIRQRKSLIHITKMHFI